MSNDNYKNVRATISTKLRNKGIPRSTNELLRGYVDHNSVNQRAQKNDDDMNVSKFFNLISK